MNKYGGGTLTTINLEGVHCVGNESNLLQCARDHDKIKMQDDCEHYETVGVSCGKFQSHCTILQ